MLLSFDLCIFAFKDAGIDLIIDINNVSSIFENDWQNNRKYTAKNLNRSTEAHESADPIIGTKNPLHSLQVSKMEINVA